MAWINVTEQTKDAVQKLITQAYIYNAKVDRMKSVMVADFSYNVSSDLLHEMIAHYFSNALGDTLSVMCMERYNIPVVFGGVPVMDKQYTSPEAIFLDLLETVVDFQNQMSACVHIAVESGDRQISSELFEIIRDFNKVVDQCILMYDKIKLYGSNPAFDAHLERHYNLIDGKLKLLGNVRMKDIKLKE